MYFGTLSSSPIATKRLAILKYTYASVESAFIASRQASIPSGPEGRVPQRMAGSALSATWEPAGRPGKAVIASMSTGRRGCRGRRLLLSISKFGGGTGWAPGRYLLNQIPAATRFTASSAKSKISLVSICSWGTDVRISRPSLPPMQVFPSRCIGVPAPSPYSGFLPAHKYICVTWINIT